MKGKRKNKKEQIQERRHSIRAHRTPRELYRYFLDDEFMNLMHSSTASLLCESSTTTGGADCCRRLLLCLAGVQSGEAAVAAAAFLVADDEDRNALTMLTLARL